MQLGDVKWVGLYSYHAMFARTTTCFVGTETEEPQSKQATAEESLKGNTGGTNTEGLLGLVYEFTVLPPRGAYRGWFSTIIVRWGL